MKKYFIYSFVCLATILILIRCAKDNSNEEVKAKEEEAASVSTANYSDHLIPAGEARVMMDRYNQLLGSVIENKFKEQNPNYVSPYMVIHDIDPMIEFLTHLKQKGYSKVNVQFAAINGDGVNGRISGLPYHTLLFYGNKINKGAPNMKKTTDDDEEFYNHGSLAPPPTCSPTCLANCHIFHTHCLD
jgi:hypothetical protein